MNQSFLFFELIGVFIVHWLILEPQTHVVVEQFGAENIPLLSGRLVYHFHSQRKSESTEKKGTPFVFQLHSHSILLLQALS